MNTAKAMNGIIGATMLVAFEKCWVRCTIADVRVVYNVHQLLVTPDGGAGSQWVTMARVKGCDELEKLRLGHGAFDDGTKIAPNGARVIA